MIKFDDIELMLYNSIKNPDLFDLNDRKTLTGLYQLRNNINTLEEDMDEELKNILYEVINNALELMSIKLLNTTPETYSETTQELEEHEKHFQNLLQQFGEPKFRDHIIHAKRNYWLGILLHPYITEKKMTEEEIHIWYPIARYHDICYILQEIEKVTRLIEKRIQNAFKNIDFNMNTNIILGEQFFREKQLELLYLLNNISGIEVEDLQKISLLEMLDKNEHSILSAFFIFDLFHEENFIPHIVASESDLRRIVRSIALHNDTLTQVKINGTSDFFTGLLILTDEIQEWGRPSVDPDRYRTEYIEIENLLPVFKQISTIDDLFSTLYEDGEVDVPSVDISGEDTPIDAITSKLIFSQSGDEYELRLKVKVIPGVPLSFLEGDNVDADKELDVRVKKIANKFISILNNEGKDIGLDILNFNHLDLIGTPKTVEELTYEFPLCKKTKGYPLLTNKKLLRDLIVYWVRHHMKAVDTASFPDIELGEETTIHFIFPEYREGTVKSKKRNLHRINDGEFNWNVEVYADIGPQKEKIFPVEKLR